MEDDVPNEERIVARQRVYKLLEKFEKDDFQLSDFFPEAEFQETMHTPTHLFSALKKCQQHGISDVSLKTLKSLIENQQCGKHFLWKMFVNFLQKDCAFFLPQLSEFIKVFLKSQKIHHDELRLFHTVILMNKEMYEKAHQQACNFNAKESILETNFAETAKAASSTLLVGYKTILDYRTIDTDDDEMLNVLKESFLLIFSKKTCEPLFAESFTYILMKLELQEEAETFLEKYVEKESKGNIGISAALHALNIIKLHIPKASLKLNISLLEMIANRDSGNPKVLDLCQHYLNILNSDMCSHSEKESDSDEGATSFAPIRNGLNKCLQLIMYFLDMYVKYLPSAVVREGWSVMAEIMRRICVQEAKNCFQSIVDLWHNDRKRWWPCFRLPHSGLPSTLPTDDAEFYSNKAFVCYVLESQYHPFVVSIMEHKECRLLKSLMEQLRHPKIKFDSHIKALQEANEVAIGVPLVSQPIVPRVSVTTPQTQMTPSLSIFSTINSEAIAVEFQKHMLTVRPMKLKDEYNRVAKAHKNTKKILQLDVNNMLSRRYAKRRTISVQNKNLRMTRAKRAATISTCSVRSLDSLDSSDQTEDDGDDTMTDGTLSQDDEDDSSAELLPNPCELNENVLVKDRWKIFIKTGRWRSLSVDEENSSGEEYAPPFLSDDDSYSDEFDDEFYEGEAKHNNYPASIASSYSSLSPASSISVGYTPDLQFSNSPSTPRDVIRNEDHYRFMEFDSFSVGSTSTTDEIAKNITQVIRKLDVDYHNTDFENRAEEYVVEEDIVIPETVLVQSSSRNNIVPSEDGLADKYYDVEKENDLTEKTFASNVNNRSFSRDFGASSPDMFASFSEDEDREAAKYFDEKRESGNQNKSKDDDHRKVMNSTTNHQKTPSSAVSTSFVVTTPSAVSTPIRKRKDKKNLLRSATQRKLINKQSASDSRPSGSKKTSKDGVSKLSSWNISLVDRVLKESLASEGEASLTSNLTKLSTLETETGMEEQSCTRPVKKPRLSAVTTPKPVIRPVTVSPPKTIRKGKQNKKVDRVLKESVASEGEASLTSNLTKVSTFETETGMEEQSSTRPVKKPRLSAVTTPKSVIAPVTVSPPKTMRKGKQKKKADAKSETLDLRNATLDQANQKSVSGSRSSGSSKKSKREVPKEDSWKLSLVDDLLKKSLVSEEKSSPISKSAKRSAVETETCMVEESFNQPGVSNSNLTKFDKKIPPKTNSKKKVDDKSKTLRLGNKTKCASDSRLSENTKKSKGVSKDDSWKMSLVDRLLAESLVSQKKSTSKSKLSPAVDPVPVTSTKKKSQAKVKKVSSTSATQGKSRVDPHAVRLPSEPDIVDRQPTSCRAKPLQARKCHIRERDPNYLSPSDSEPDVSA